MNKIYFTLITLFATIFLILFVFYNRYQKNYIEEQINEKISKNVDILYETLSFEKRYAQALSIMLSKDINIINSLKNSNQKLALKRLKEFLKELKDTTKIDYIDIQVHTKDLKAFARSWDKSNYFGAKLNNFRKGLVKVKEQKRSFVSIELGKRLNIKAISPIFDKNGNYIGSIEVISSFKGLKEHLKKFNLSVLGFLDKRYLNVAVDLKDNKKVGDFVVVEKNYNKKIYNLLKNNPYILEKKRFFYHIDNKIVALLPMKNVGIDDIGLIVLMMPNLKYNSNYLANDYKRENREYKYNQNHREVIIK